MQYFIFASKMTSSGKSPACPLRRPAGAGGRQYRRQRAGPSSLLSTLLQPSLQAAHEFFLHFVIQLNVSEIFLNSNKEQSHKIEL